jgi:hypothetical protein
MAYIETTTNTFAAPAKFNLLKWLLRLGASFGDADRQNKTEDRILKDVGITRQQANVAFYRQFAEKRY